MKDTIRKRIEEIQKAESPEDLRKCVCPFYEKGGHTDCVTCLKDEASIETCKDYYLERIATNPMDVWCEDFDKIITLTRDAQPIESLVGVGITCNTCYMNERCPLYKKDYACGIDWKSNKPKTPAEFMDFLIDMQYERVRRSAVFEKIDGGVSDLGLSGEMDRLNSYIAQKEDMGRDRVSVNIEASASSGSSGGGILAKLFGGGSSQPALDQAKPSAIDIDAVEIKDTEKLKRNSHA